MIVWALGRIGPCAVYTIILLCYHAIVLSRATFLTVSTADSRDYNPHNEESRVDRCPDFLRPVEFAPVKQESARVEPLDVPILTSQIVSVTLSLLLYDLLDLGLSNPSVRSTIAGLVVPWSLCVLLLCCYFSYTVGIWTFLGPNQA